MKNALTGKFIENNHWKKSCIITEDKIKRITPDVDWIPRFLGWNKDERRKQK